MKDGKRESLIGRKGRVVRCNAVNHDDGGMCVCGLIGQGIVIEKEHMEDPAGNIYYVARGKIIEAAETNIGTGEDAKNVFF